MGKERSETLRTEFKWVFVSRHDRSFARVWQVRVNYFCFKTNQGIQVATTLEGKLLASDLTEGMPRMALAVASFRSCVVIVSDLWFV